MSKGVMDRGIGPEQRKKAGADKKTANGENADEQRNGKSDPVDLEDYKGARKKLRHAVKAVVKNKSGAIAEKLVGKVEEGDMRGTEMVLSLIEKKKQGKDVKKKKRSGPNWEELLGSEPEWDESMEENEKKPAEVGGKD